MSDFGSVISIEKLDKSEFSQEEKQHVISTFEKEKKEGNYTDMMGEDLKFQLVADEPTELLFMFTEYWFGEGDDEEMFEFAKDNDFDEIEEIAAVISEKLNNSYHVKADFIEW